MREEKSARLRFLRRKIRRRKPRFINLARWWHDGSVKSWRRPRGIDNKQRLRLKSRPRLPGVGYKNPEAIRGLHPSGFRWTIVHNVGELRKAKEEGYGMVYIGATVGKRKRVVLQKAAEEMGVRIANPIEARVREEVE